MTKGFVSLLAMGACLCGSATLGACAINPPAPHMVTSEQDPQASIIAGTGGGATSKTRRHISTISIGINELPITFNPHVAAGDTFLTRVIASLTLPSAFNDGALNTDLLVSAGIISADQSMIRDSTDGQIVRYVINPSAQWSDATPITGSDFNFLWQQMITSSDAINPAGYRLIDKITTSSDGRTVDVHFTQKYGEWNTLFDFLLPSHALRNGNADFSSMMTKSIPASAGKYQFGRIDDLGILQLNRNDRYWGNDAARTERLLFRAVSMPSQMASMLRLSNLDIVDTTPGAAASSKLSKVGGTQVRSLTTDRSLNLVFNQNSNLLSSAGLRASVAHLIDFNQLYSTTIDPSYDSDLPTRATIPSASSYTEGTRPIRIAGQPGDATANAVAQALVTSLQLKGYSAEYVDDDSNSLYNTDIPNGTVDIVVVWQHTPSTITQLMSRYGCTNTSKNQQSTNSTTDQNSNPVIQRADNIAGFCSDAIEQDFNQAITGKISFTDLNNAIAQYTESSVVSFPIIKDIHINAVAGTLSASSASSFAQWPSDTDTGIFINMDKWITSRPDDEE